MPTILKLLILLCSLALARLAVAAPMTSDELLQHYRYLHQNPELSLQEKNTAAYLARELKTLGYEVTTGIGGHGLVGVLRNGDGPTIMYRADMDALPVTEATGLPYASQATGLSLTGEEVQVMHACGHDVHMTVLLGVASRLATRRDDWQGTLLLVLQPAEELGAGARAMLDDGLFQRFPTPQAALALHVSASLPTGQLGYVSGFAMANVDEVDLTIFGRGGHGAYPHTTIDPVLLSAQIITALQQIVSREVSPLESAVVTVGSIHGGTKHNVIPDEVRLQLTVRSYSDNTRTYLLRRIEEIAQGLARSARLPEDRLPVMTVRDEYTPAVYNEPELVERAAALMRAALGEQALVGISPVMGGEDFSRYARTPEQVPVSLFSLGTVSPDRHAAAARGELNLPSLHSALFAPDAGPAIRTGVDAMTAALTGLLQAP